MSIILMWSVNDWIAKNLVAPNSKGVSNAPLTVCILPPSLSDASKIIQFIPFFDNT
jgi:hypothetical protein